MSEDERLAGRVNDADIFPSPSTLPLLDFEAERESSAVAVSPCSHKLHVDTTSALDTCYFFTEAVPQASLAFSSCSASTVHL
jgi:hypothetical protein